MRNQVCGRYVQVKRMKNLSKNQEIKSVRPVIWVVVIPVLCLAPFLTKAFHIDDTLFLWAAEQIQLNPMDFYGFPANWYGFDMPMFDINKNPPFVSYYIAAVALIFGFNEVSLHLAFLIPAVGISLGTYYLARPYCKMPQLASLIAVATPVFVVSSSNVMSDTMMVFFYVTASALWIRGLEEENTICLFAASILITLAVLSKYFGITLIPLLLAYSLMVKRRMGGWVFFLIIPLVATGLYQFMTYALYGKGLLGDAAIYSVSNRLGNGMQFSIKLLTGLSFMGGCLISSFFFIPFLWARRSLFWGAVGIIFLFIFIEKTGLPDFLIPENSHSFQPWLKFQFAIYVLSGLHILILSITELWRNRDAFSWFLVFWIMGTFIFTSFVNWTINARSIYPMLPAVAVLVTRKLESGAISSILKNKTRMLLPLIPALIVSISVGWADSSLADCQRKAADMIHEKFQRNADTIWFQGHWGFQYYMERFGAKPIYFNKSKIAKNDTVVVPSNNSNVIMPDKEKFKETHKFELMPCRWISTMSSTLRAGFYWDGKGCMPYSFGKTEPEKYLIYIPSL